MAIFDVNTLGTATNLIVFNDETLDPYFRVTRRYPTKRELEEYETLLPESLGINDYESFIGKSLFLIDGKLLPNTEFTFHQGRERIRKLSSIVTEQADPLSDNGYVPYKWTENVPKMLMVKVLYVDMEENTKQGYVQPFSLLCKVKYPIITSQTSKSVTLTPGTFASSGGFQVPMRVPLQITAGPTNSASKYPVTYPVIWGASATSQASGSGTNAGDFFAYPVIQIQGPIQTPRVTNNTTGQYIELAVNLPSPSDSAFISYNQSGVNITALGQNVYGKLTSGSTQWVVVPGANTFTLTGSSVGTGAQATVTFFDSWPLS